MGDIFISYSRKDKAKAKPIADALQNQGWSVWWDQKIPVGKSFEKVVEEQIAEAKCVMVLWSENSVKSDWVRAEADEGRKRNILAPVLIDKTSIPLGFSRFQAADLIDWSGDTNADVFTMLVNDIKNIIGGNNVAGDDEIELWEKTKSKDNIESYKDYFSKYNKGRFSEKARIRISELTPDEPSIRPGRSTKNLALSKSRLAFTIFTLILSIVFFIGYYLYYVPGNKNDLVDNGFLILKNIKKSMQEQYGVHQQVFTTYLNSWDSTTNYQENTTKIQHLLDSNNAGGKVLNVGKQPILKYIIDGELIFLSNNSNSHSFVISIPIESFVPPILQPLKTELFESYLLINKNGLIYKDSGLGIGEGIRMDSLFAGNKIGMVAAVKDMNIENKAYKMFSYPLNLGNEEVLLCGFLKTKAYNARLHEIDVSFIYPIVIISLLLIIFLPLIKFYIMGADDHVRLMDIALSVLSLFVGATLITLTLIQVLLLGTTARRSEKNLYSLSHQIDSGFQDDLTNAYRQLDLLDSLVNISLDPTSRQKLTTDGYIDVSDIIINYYLTGKKNALLYYDFDRVSWIDESGRQRIKGQVFGLPSFVNVSGRKYFTLIKNADGYMLPGHPGSTFAFEAIYNWVNGEFRIVVSKSSRFNQDYVPSLSAQMHSVTETILPPGYGFCITDNNGEVQLHSDMNRNRRENIIEKMSPSQQIKEAIKSSGESFFNEITFYGKRNALYIKPFAKTPFYLITYCDKDYFLSINMRVFNFALVFCFSTFLMCILIWLLAFRKPFYAYPMLYSPMDFLKGSIPREGASHFYILAARLMAAYILMLVFFILLSNYVNINNYDIFLTGLLLPINVIYGLFVLSYSTVRHMGNNNSWKIRKRSKEALTAIFFQLIVSLFVYLYSASKGYPVGSAFLCFQLFFNLLMWLNYFSSKKLLSVLSVSKRPYLAQFSSMALHLIICIAVLPACLYTWYAHNQEITQSIRKEQLYLAESLQKRKGRINKLIKERNNLNPPGRYFEKLQYYSGIYKIYRDTIIVSSDPLDIGHKKYNYDQFYFDIANDIGSNYYDPLLLPALQNGVKDNSWYWIRQPQNTLSFWYNLNQDKSRTNDSAFKSLKIVSVYPERHKFTSLSTGGILLVFFIVSLLQGLFWLLNSLTGRIFLKKYILIAKKSELPENKIASLFHEYNELNNNAFDKRENKIAILQNEFDVYNPGESYAEIYDQEKHMIDSIEKLKPFYQFVWQKCSEKEKYLLLNFAQDGLANYKNAPIIYGLLQKGVFIIHDGVVNLFSASFRAYLLTKKNTREIYELQKTFLQNSTWQSLRRPLLIILLGIALFIFLTQEETFQKVMALVLGISCGSSLLVKFFVDGREKK